MAVAGSIVVDLLMKTGSFETDSQRAEKRLKEFQKRVLANAKAIGTVILGGATVAGGALVALTLNAARSMDKLDELSNRFGIAADKLSVWGYAAKLTGADLDGMARGVGLLSKNLAAAADGKSRMGELFRALGVSATDAEGNLRKVEDVLPEIADRFAALDNSTTETALAMELFGRSGAELLEFLNLGAQGIRDYEAELASLGGVVLPDAAAQAAAFFDELDRLKTAGSGLGILIASQLAPALAETSKEFRSIVTSGELAGNVVSTVDGLMKAGIWTIEAYNQAVERTAILFEMAARYGAGTVQIARNLATLGIADGSVLDGFRMQRNAISDGIAERNASDRRRGAGDEKPAVIFAGEGVEPDGFFAKSEAEVRLEEQRAAIEARIQKLLAGTGGGSGGKGGSDALKAAQELQQLADAQAGWSDRLLDLQADLDGPVAKANREYQRQMQDLEKAFQNGEVALADYAKMQDALAASRDKDLEAINAQQTPYERMLEDLAFELELIGKSNEEREIAIAQRWAGVEAMSAEGKRLEELISGDYRLDEAVRDQIDAMDALRDAGGDFFTDWTSGAKSFKDAALDAWDSLHQKILSMIAENLMDQLFGKSGDAGGGKWGDAIGSIFGSMFGGGKAGGGDVLAGRGYWIGEEGPEWFQPRTAGTIVPNEPAMAMAGGGGRGGPLIGALNFNGYGRPDRRTTQQAAADLATAANRALARNGKGGR